jgi:Flp pilus assembly protein TadG
MAIEIVLLTPVLIAFTLLVVAGGRLVARQSDVDSTARDAARAASIERSEGSARSVGEAVTLRDGDTCDPPAVDTSDWPPAGNVRAGSVTVTVTCQVSYAGLGLIGLQGSTTVIGTSTAPVDQYRRQE